MPYFPVTLRLTAHLQRKSQPIPVGFFSTVGQQLTGSHPITLMALNAASNAGDIRYQIRRNSLVRNRDKVPEP